MDNLIERITPSNIDAERAVLGAMLLDKEAVAKVLEILTFHHFYVPNHQIIFKIIYDLYNQNHPIDLVTASDSLRRQSYLEDIGGYTYLLDLSDSVPTTANVEQYARIVEEKYLRRELIRITNELNNMAYESGEEIASLLDKAEQSIFNVGQGRNSSDMVHIKELLVDNFESISDGFPEDGNVPLQTGISTGIADLDAMTNGLNPSDLIILAARPAMGKMESVDNMIVTPTGKIRMGDIKVGQKICGSNSQNYNVTGVFPQGLKDSYRVSFDDDTFVDCGLEHLWEVSNRQDRKNPPHSSRVITTKEMLKKLYLPDGRKNYSVKIADPVHFEQKNDLTVHPYLLGCYLGDGYCDISNILFSNIEKDIIEKFSSCLSENDELVINQKDHRIKRKKGNHTTSDLFQALEKLGLRDKKSDEKFIPEQYLYSSLENRINLIQGLVDTDGFVAVENRNHIEYSTTSKQMCMNILELVRGLGGKANYKEKEGSYTKTIDSINQVIKTKTYYRINFSFANNIIPVSSKKHLEKYSQEKKYHKKFVTGIEHVGQAEMQCIMVDSPDHLYITEGYNLTHNTSFCLNLAANIALKEKYPVAIFSLEMSKEQITQRIVSSEAEVSNHHLRVGNVAKEMWEQITKAVGRLYNVPIYIDDSGSITPIEIRSKVRRLKAEHKKLGAVVIDYLQLMEGGSSDGNRVQEIAKITRALKRLAREMDVPVIALSQLSRTVEQRQNKRPQLSDLRESGCLTGDTLILDPATGERKPIVELIGKENLKTFAIDTTLKIAEHQISNVFYSGKKMVYEILTRTGRKIKASANHPFLKLSGWERLDVLKTGDKIAVARNINITPEINSMSDDELILLAHLLGDGCILPSQPYHYTSADMANINMVKDTAERLFKIEPRVVQQKNWYHAYLPSPYRLTHGKTHPITGWYDKLNIDRARSYDKVIPNDVFKNNNAKISLFLKHLWATDGNISTIISKNNRKNSVSIYYATSSQTMAYQVQHLLLRLGIMSSLKSVKSNKGYRLMYHIVIQGSENQIKFLSEVGCYGSRGQNIAKIIENLQQIKANPNYDVIPKEAWKFIIEPAKYEAKIGWREFCENLNMSYCGTTLFKHGISRERMSRIYKVLPQQKIKELSESDILWDEIISVTEIGIEDVYDATVPGVHNFVANDFIVHNSIEQDADIVMFIYRDEYYNPDSDKKKTAELIIAKHRNGPVGTVELYFDASLTKFSGLEKYT